MKINRNKKITAVKKKIVRVGIPILSAFLLFSCVSNKKYESLQAQLDNTENELAKVKVDKQMTEYDKADIQYVKTMKLAEQQDKMLQLSNQLDSIKMVLAERTSRLENLKSSLESSSDSEDWIIEALENRLMIDLDHEVFFDKGSNQLSSSGVEKIKRLSNTVKTSDEKLKIWVIGHTDNLKYKSDDKNNWMLSSERALAVVETMIEAGVNPIDITAAARSWYKPEANNNMPTGREENRRTEIFLIPADEINSMLYILSEESM